MKTRVSRFTVLAPVALAGSPEPAATEAERLRQARALAARFSAEEVFKKMLAAGSPLSKKLEEKIEQGFERFLEEGSRWEKKKAGFKK